MRQFSLIAAVVLICVFTALCIAAPGTQSEKLTKEVTTQPTYDANAEISSCRQKEEGPALFECFSRIAVKSGDGSVCTGLQQSDFQKFFAKYSASYKTDKAKEEFVSSTINYCYFILGLSKKDKNLCTKSGVIKEPGTEYDGAQYCIHFIEDLENFPSARLRVCQNHRETYELAGVLPAGC